MLEDLLCQRAAYNVTLISRTKTVEQTMGPETNANIYEHLRYGNICAEKPWGMSNVSESGASLLRNPDWWNETWFYLTVYSKK